MRVSSTSSDPRNSNKESSCGAAVGCALAALAAGVAGGGAATATLDKARLSINRILCPLKPGSSDVTRVGVRAFFRCPIIKIGIFLQHLERLAGTFLRRRDDVHI